MDYLKREHAYGNKITGKTLDAHFEGIGYGWDPDVLRLVLAVLLRGGAIEVTHQGRKHRNHNDPACRAAFVTKNAFRAASFAPRETFDLKMLANAARAFEEITGNEVDIEEVGWPRPSRSWLPMTASSSAAGSEHARLQSPRHASHDRFPGNDRRHP